MKAPDPLTRWDIPTQWLISVLGFTLGGWMLVSFVIAARRSYQWEPGGQRLTLHDGTSLVPADLVDLDKRKWHKFYVTLKTSPDHPTLRGRDVELDLFRYLPLEDWVLEMERTRFPERATQEAAEKNAATGDAARPATDGGGDGGVVVTSAGAGGGKGKGGVDTDGAGGDGDGD